ncbi:MAG: hypothetical protein M5R36_14475 [Deltaproteobacteria bacterium]|nr:hypothetical protein [Deltaproteobacteria bacterium]
MHGMEYTLGTEIRSAVIFDRDYRTNRSVKAIIANLEKSCQIVHIHRCKEIENFLLNVNVIDRAIKKRVTNYNMRTGEKIIFEENVEALLMALSDQIKDYVFGQYMEKRSAEEKAARPSVDPSKIATEIFQEYEKLWSDYQSRMAIVPGKQMLRQLNEYLQKKFRVSLTSAVIINSFKRAEVPSDIQEIIKRIGDLKGE